MIGAAELRDALAKAVKRAVDMRVHFNHVMSSDRDYAWIQLKPRRQDEGYGYSKRLIMVDIEVVKIPDGYAEVKHSDLYEIVDRLEEVLSAGLWVGDRHLNVQDTAAHIYDDILHYEFKLEFADAVYDAAQEEAYEAMKELEIEWAR